MKVTLADVNREVDKFTHIGKFSEILDIARKKAEYAKKVGGRLI